MPYGLTLRYNYGNIKSYIDYVIKGREKCGSQFVMIMLFSSVF